MLIQEYPVMLNEVKRYDLIRTKSDSNLKIKQLETGLVFEEAIDSYPTVYTYEETNENIYFLDEKVS